MFVIREQQLEQQQNEMTKTRNHRPASRISCRMSSNTVDETCDSFHLSKEAIPIGTYIPDDDGCELVSHHLINMAGAIMGAYRRLWDLSAFFPPSTCRWEFWKSSVGWPDTSIMATRGGQVGTEAVRLTKS